MTSGAFVSVKLNVPLVEVMISGNCAQLMSDVKFVFHSTRHSSCVGANHVSRNPPLVYIAPLNAGSGLTTTAKLFVALSAGTPLAVTTVVKVLLLPDCATSGVHVITPFVR